MIHEEHAFFSSASSGGMRETGWRVLMTPLTRERWKGDSPPPPAQLTPFDISAKIKITTVLTIPAIPREADRDQDRLLFVLTFAAMYLVLGNRAPWLLWRFSLSTKTVDTQHIVAGGGRIMNNE
jgi:hypothetical protein